jgi:hypothetical protein
MLRTLDFILGKMQRMGLFEQGNGMQEIKGTASGNWEDQTHEAEVIAHGA